MLKAAILGYGGIAQSHRLGYERLEKENAPVRLAALCDIDPSRFENDAARRYACYTDLETMLREEKPDIVDICLPTYLHMTYALQLLERGIHVQCEKPMGRTTAECERLLAAAEKGGAKLMIGMCLRFEPLYLPLKEMVDTGRYGRVLTARFDRVGTLPVTGFENWYWNYEKSGGAALDLHIHDVDMIQWLFGKPTAVRALTSDCRVPCTTIESAFLYPDKLVTAVGDWGQSASSPFRMEYRVTFEQASVVMNAQGVTVYPQQGEPFALTLPQEDRMAQEILYFANSILNDTPNDRITLADAAADVRLVEKLMKSAAANGEKVEV